METQKSVGVTIGQESSHSASQSSSQSSSQSASSQGSSGAASHESNQQPGKQPATQTSHATSQRTSQPAAQTLPQIPNQALLVSGSKLPRMPIFNSVSTGSVASDRRATIVRPRPNPAKRTTSTLAVAWGRLPQTGEVAVGSSVLLGLILLVALGLHAYRTLRH